MIEAKSIIPNIDKLSEDGSIDKAIKDADKFPFIRGVKSVCVNGDLFLRSDIAYYLCSLSGNIELTKFVLLNSYDYKKSNKVSNPDLLSVKDKIEETCTIEKLEKEKESFESLIKSFGNVECTPKKFNTYVLSDNTGTFKIGRAINVDSRIKELKCANPNIELVLSIDKNIETSLHRKFCDKRIYSEWFSLNRSDFDYIVNRYNDQISFIDKSKLPR